MAGGCFWFIFQTVHTTFSLGPLLGFMADLRGSIVVNAAGKVENYQDFGGGISTLFECVFIAFLIYLIAGIFKRNYGRKAAIISHFIAIFLLKGAMIWNIYFSGRTDARIIEAFPLKTGIFLADIVALVAGFIIFQTLACDTVQE